MHVIGSPFIQGFIFHLQKKQLVSNLYCGFYLGPALSFIFRTPHGDVYAKPLEYYSDSVLFFTLPPYPLPHGVTVSPNTEVKVTALVTNDGRTFSNPLEFTYIASKLFLFFLQQFLNYSVK